MVACLTHDIGYVRGVVKGDEDDGYGLLMRLVARFHCRADPRTPRSRYITLARSKLFVLDRVAAIQELDGERIARAIGYTQFPYNHRRQRQRKLTKKKASLLRAANLIGQLGDPHYLEKSQCALLRI